MGSSSGGRIVRVVLGVVALAVGGVWTGQGLGLIAGSFMTGSQMWLVIGLVVAVVGVVLLVSGLRPARRRDRL